MVKNDFTYFGRGVIQVNYIVPPGVMKTAKGNQYILNNRYIFTVARAPELETDFHLSAHDSLTGKPLTADEVRKFTDG